MREQAGTFQRLRGKLVRRLAAALGPEGRRHERVLEYRHVSERTWNLIATADSSPAARCRAVVGHVAIGETHLTMIGGEDSADEIEQRRLACPVGPDDAERVPIPE